MLSIVSLLMLGSFKEPKDVFQVFLWVSLPLLAFPVALLALRLLRLSLLVFVKETTRI